MTTVTARLHVRVAPWLRAYLAAVCIVARATGWAPSDEHIARIARRATRTTVA